MLIPCAEILRDLQTSKREYSLSIMMGSDSSGIETIRREKVGDVDFLILTAGPGRRTTVDLIQHIKAMEEPELAVMVCEGQLQGVISEAYLSRSDQTYTLKVTPKSAIVNSLQKSMQTGHLN